MNIEYPELIGKRLADVDPDLLAEALEHLGSGNVSPATYIPTADEITLLKERLTHARIRLRCGCGEDVCRTYKFEYPAKKHVVTMRTVRFFVRGEALLHIDSEGDIYSLERLYDLRTEGALTVYSKCDDGTWVSRTI